MTNQKQSKNEKLQKPVIKTCEGQDIKNNNTTSNYNIVIFLDLKQLHHYKIPKLV